jgi:hypothetical protein
MGMNAAAERSTRIMRYVLPRGNREGSPSTLFLGVYFWDQTLWLLDQGVDMQKKALYSMECY